MSLKPHKGGGGKRTKTRPKTAQRKGKGVWGTLLSMSKTRATQKKKKTRCKKKKSWRLEGGWGFGWGWGVGVGDIKKKETKKMVIPDRKGGFFPLGTKEKSNGNGAEMCKKRSVKFPKRNPKGGENDHTQKPQWGGGEKESGVRREKTPVETMNSNIHF